MGWMMGSGEGGFRVESGVRGRKVVVEGLNGGRGRGIDKGLEWKGGWWRGKKG